MGATAILSLGGHFAGEPARPRTAVSPERIDLLNGSEIFRKVALDRLASPERLDTLLGFAFPRLWLVVAAGGALALALVLWWLAGRGSGLFVG